MKFDVLHNFISPVTGRILCDADYVLVGDNNGIATPSPDLIDLKLDLIDLRHDYDTAVTASFIIGFPNEQLKQAQVLSTLGDGFLINTGGIVSTSNIIPIEKLPNLTYQHIWIGDINNRPVEQLTIEIDNLPNLTTNMIWVGNSNNRPVESNELTVAESAILALQTQLLAIQAALVALEIQVSALETDLLLLQSEVEAINTEVLGLIAAVAVIQGQIQAIYTQISDLQEEILALNERIDNLRLTNIPAGGDVSLDGYRIKNLQQSPVEDFDAVSFTFLWDLMHDEVEILWP